MITIRLSMGLALGLSLAGCGAQETCQVTPCGANARVYNLCATAGQTKVRYDFNGTGCSCDTATTGGCDSCTRSVADFCGTSMPPPVPWATVQSSLVTPGCTLAPCHGAGAPGTTKLKLISGMDKANCEGVVLPANDLVNKAAPASSRLVTYPASAQHTGGKSAGWMSVTDTSAAKAVDWIKGGALCPTQ